MITPPRSRIQLNSHQILKIGGAHDALSAVMLERAGFRALWVSGFGISAAQFAMPDINLVSMTESVDATRRIAESVDVPVIVDADNGFGDGNNVARAVREFGLAGAAGVCIEDNTFPKRCSLYPGAPRELISIDEMCRKLQAARRAADPFGIFLIGRVESLIADLGIEDAVKRANAYGEAGADAVLVHAKQFAPIREIANSGRLGKPLIVVPTLYEDTPFDEMSACGIAGVILANQMLRAMVRACQPVAERMLTARSLSDLANDIVRVSDISGLVKVPAGWSPPEPSATRGASARHVNGTDSRTPGREAKRRKQVAV
ncbi:MAG TPA: isocitrate lyase/PEP mutase family protein [Planctomycetota bacterium]|nr:isocitrate lyase/PEP mutase family protein [Planctomycetota bacterium]